MSTVTSSKSPIHIKCTVGYPFGVKDDSYSKGYHTGTDFPASGTSLPNPPLYSVVENGIVEYVRDDVTSNGGDVALGNQVVIKDLITGLYYRYCHLLYTKIFVKVGDKVNLETAIGLMGNTGNSTGTHLHLELTDSMDWENANFYNPVEPLGIPNIQGTIVLYDGNVDPIPETKKKYKTPLFGKRVAKYFI